MEGSWIVRDLLGDLGDDEEKGVLAVLEGVISVLGEDEREGKGDSTLGKRRNIDRRDQEGAAKIFRDYFADRPTYTEEMFERRYRLSRRVFRRVHEAVVEYDDYFKQKRDATGLLGKSEYQKTTAAMRMLAYGASADSLDEYCRLSASTAMESLKRFARAVEVLFAEQYLRGPTVEDLKRIMATMERRGFPGCIGSIDCQHWTWKNCPTAYHGQYIGKYC